MNIILNDKALYARVYVCIIVSSPAGKADYIIFIFIFRAAGP